MVAQFTEVETGKGNARPELEKAKAACRKQAKRVIATPILAELAGAGMSIRRIAAEPNGTRCSDRSRSQVAAFSKSLSSAR